MSEQSLKDVSDIHELYRAETFGKKTIRLDPVQIELLLEKRLNQGALIDDFFIIIPNDQEGQTEISFEVEFPIVSSKLSEKYQEKVALTSKRQVKLKVFYCKDAPHAALCNSKFMNFPNVSKPKPIEGVPGHTQKVV